ncbi:gluconate 2-dehydrogenase subunit 3 family protein [Bradyrhizobium sp. LA2.1]|uniref:gluconate 2-dehydrogenase subunit 3 family protein n=1 Tax=Bradyrhizobium sp. LA2.1 TaxID=3156376 RepID=UPI003399F120
MIDGSRHFLLSRRSLLISTAALLVAGTAARARTITQGMPWEPGTASPPLQVRAGPWMFFTFDEAATIEAAVDRLIPPDERGPGGKDTGCAVYIDRQLAGAFGKAFGLYMGPPFMPGAATQGYQAPDAPATRYRKGLKALTDYVKATFTGKSFRDLALTDQDKVLSGLETGSIELANVSSVEFFSLLLQNTQEGFFADPVYGGNRDMAGWKLVGFPGTRYDYRDWVERHNEVYPLPPVSIMGRSDWTVKD